MAKKQKEGNGAHTTVQTPEQKSTGQMGERSQLPAQRTPHPLRRLRDEMDLLFDRFFGHWAGPWEPLEFPERNWDLDLQEADSEVVVRAEAPGFEAKDFDI